MKIQIGQHPDRTAAKVDLASLLETRFLVQANSGGGKSWLLRRLAEQAAPHTQIVIIDPEGEFATLRERYDFVICAPKDADAVAHPRSAALLARKLLETGVSAVVDIYELKAHERPAFVRAFFDALVNAPRNLWRPVLIVLDEAHMFAPEKGKAESTGAVIDLATRGRKRGFALCCATQRLSKLHKDVAAEMLNKFIGRTGLDLDVERAADELGMGRKVAFEKLRGLPAGDFYAFGPAIATVPTQIRVGDVETSHPKAGGHRLAAPPPASPKIREVLAKLGDLPKEAEQELHTLEDLRRELAVTRGRLTTAEKRAGQTGIPEADVQKRIAAALAQQPKAAPDTSEAHPAVRALAVIEHTIGAARREMKRKPGPGKAVKLSEVPPLREILRDQVPHLLNVQDDGSLPKGERDVLIATAQHSDGATREQLTVLTGYKRSTRDTYLQRLRARGMVEQTGDMIAATEEGRAALGADFKPLPTGAALRAHWLRELPEGERKVLEVLIEAYPREVEREVVSETTGYKRSTRDTYLQRLTTRKLVDAVARGGVRASKVLFA